MHVYRLENSVEHVCGGSYYIEILEWFADYFEHIPYATCKSGNLHYICSSYISTFSANGGYQLNVENKIVGDNLSMFGTKIQSHMSCIKPIADTGRGLQL